MMENVNEKILVPDQNFDKNRELEMKNFAVAALLFLQISEGIACDPRERDFASSLSGSKFLIHSFDEQYFSEMGNPIFRTKQLLKYMNFSRDTYSWPII